MGFIGFITYVASEGVHLPKKHSMGTLDRKKEIRHVENLQILNHKFHRGKRKVSFWIFTPYHIALWRPSLPGRGTRGLQSK